MEHPLERLLIYTDKNHIDEFEIPNSEYDELYELYITTKDDVLEDHHTSVDFFNEVFYNLTCIYASDDAAENINSYLYNGTSLFPPIPELENPQTKQALNQAKEYENIAQDACYFVMGFVWVILKKQKELPRHVRFFVIALEHALEDSYSDFDIFSRFVREHDTKYSISFEIKPEFDFAMCLCTTQEWIDATDDFDQIVVEAIIRRFKTRDEREQLVNEIRNALAEENKDPNSSSKVSMVSHRLKANNKFLDELLKQKEEEDKHAIALEQAIEKSKDERIAELEAQIKELKREKSQAIREKEEAEHKRDIFKEKLDSLTNRLNKKYIPASLKSKEAELILNELMKKDVISPLGHNTSNEFVIQCYRWDESAALFGYFIDRMNFQLELNSSGGNINWKEFKPAFSNYEEKIKRARDTVSLYRQHKEVKKPEKAEIIDEAIATAEKIMAGKQNAHKTTTILPGLPSIPNGI